MTDTEIVKALECCQTNDERNCVDCPYCEDCVEDNNIAADALNLIKRQQAEIERLNTNMDSMVAEHKRLIKNTKSEAIKEFAKELIINLDGDIEAYANAGHGLNVYEWFVSYMNSKGAIENEHREQ